MVRIFLTLLAFTLLPLSATAQEIAPAPEPAPVVAAEAAKADGPVVIELFSSQACVFCPRADRLFADLIGQDNVIGLACHVDYFDVKTGSLARTFCSDRQVWYENLLRVGPKYTPQMVLQGYLDAVGYKLDSIVPAMKKAVQSGTALLNIAAQDGGVYSITLPSDAKNVQGAVFLALYDKPHSLNIAEGRNKGQKMAYYNIVSAFQEMGSWKPGQKSAVIKPALREGHGGFAVLIQDKATGKIVAAGKQSAEKSQ